MQLHELNAGSRKKRKRVGRGPGSGLGKTCGRGHKGAKSRSGFKNKRGFEGGQTPLKRRLPKFGFTNPNRQTYQLINLDRLEKLEQLTDGASLEMQQMLEMGLIRNTKTPVKLLGRGSLTKKIKITVDKASRGAVESVTQAGGEVIIPS
ncbi:MAG: 50S ribosomal protein L15 [Deltaproteobacteria bacterium]|nr:50S ribosomal protein L15 [Deltaproteobacteria bacterium]MDP6204186.1 50S ribosomal protein L15 [SAR324 cluster bacterium]NBR19084.1 50S ribosomal protein L15 [Pseudomonadota bacterium]MDP6381774.1 50S ribosomal protein L15 [SAR324 cluster bacterium]MEC7085961.1 50S ribosomal protein L15 [SAR324 cluster bacterium]